MTSWSVELLQALWEHKPESQVLTPGIIELELELVRPIEMRPDGFRHAASDEAAVLINALWHCEDSDLKNEIYQPNISLQKRSNLRKRQSSGETSTS